MPQRRVFVTDAFGVLQDACIAAVQAVQTAQPLSPLTILVPHDSLAEHLRQAIARAGRGHLGVRFFSLTDFARECAEDRLTRHGWRPLPQLAGPLIMKQLLAQLGPEHLFGGLADQPGFPASVLATLAECKDAGISADHLQTFVPRARLTGAYRAKIESLATLYHHYQRFLTERRLYDEQDLLDQAAFECDAPPVAAALQDRDGLVFFPWRAGQAYASATPTLSWLRSLGLTYTPLARAAESELSRLHQSLFEEALPRAASAGAVSPSVRCLAAPSDSREAREISRTVLSLVRDHQLRFSEIGIVLRDPDRYGRLLTETFDNLDIPSWLSSGLPLLHTAAGQALHLLCRMLVEDYAPDRVFEFLTVSRPPDAMARPAQLDRWQALVRQAGIVGGVTAWQDGLARLETAYRAEARSSNQAAAELSVVRACRAFMRGLFAMAEQRPSQLSWHAWADYSLRLYRTYSSPTSYTDQIEALVLDLAQLDLIGSHQRSAEAGDPNRFNMSSPSLEDWATAVSRALATPHPTGQTDGVFIGDLATARGRRFRAVIIPGMLDGGFPRSPRQDPLLLDAERQHLAETLGCELAQRGQRNEEERLLFCLATQTAVEHLILSYPSHDRPSSRPQLPSWYLLRVLEALRGRVQTFADLEAWSQRVPLAPVYAGPVQQAQDSLEFHLATVEQALAGGDMAALGYLPLALPAFSAARQAVGQRLDSPRLTAFDGLLEAPQARHRLRQLFPTGVCVSPSALEPYARCPFQYFLSQVLGLTPRDETEGLAGLSPRQRGLLLLTAHRAKGLEFDHVVVLDGNWDRAGIGEDRNAPRRLYYVAMTRARQSLTLARLPGAHRIQDALEAVPSVLRRAAPVGLPEAPPEMARRYRRLSLRDVFLSYAGYRAPEHPVHRSIAALASGDPLRVRTKGARWQLLNRNGVEVGRLSSSFEPPPGMRCASASVLAVATWSRDKSDPEYQEKLHCDEWEVVVPELVFEPA